MSTVIRPKTGRPRLGDDKKKIKVTTNLPPDLMQKLEADVEDGVGANVSNLIYQIVKKYYSNR